MFISLEITLVSVFQNDFRKPVQCSQCNFHGHPVLTKPQFEESRYVNLFHNVLLDTPLATDSFMMGRELVQLYVDIFSHLHILQYTYW